METEVDEVGDATAHPDPKSLTSEATPDTVVIEHPTINKASSSTAFIPERSSFSEQQPRPTADILQQPHELRTAPRNILHISKGKASMQHQRTAQWQADVSTQIVPGDSPTPGSPRLSSNLDTELLGNTTKDEGMPNPFAILP